MGGRKKGTPNKNRSLLDELEEIVTEDGQPVSVVKMFFSGLMTMAPYQQVDALLEFMQFLYPKLKSGDLALSGNGGLIGVATTTTALSKDELIEVIKKAREES